ncbi:ABC transporter permease [Williamsia sp. DF01-3]|uniref:ABC transporter permease n=1 Tax=Williamsia sp. DF01-3 TaxID=2934157 RepID=UPI001FF31F40|nr:ABC transporter permease [Williamsia sp. DF01-3]MCK0515764.1 ABC transporter permease [Williamsia sp. DF01-3]
MRALLLVTAALVLVTVGAGQAAAAPDAAPVAPTTGGKQLPKGMPTELNQFVAGTDEFKNGPWFKGVCADKGGDFAGYLAAMFPNEEALRYWGLPADQKVKLIQAKAMGLVVSNVELPSGESLPAEALRDEAKAKEAADAGWAPPSDWYQETFPNDRSEFYPSATPVCAADLKRWTSEAITTWGFKWAKQPDAASMDIMTAAEDGPRRTNAEAGDPQRNRIEDPCNTGEKRGWAYCEHAFFVNCDQASIGNDRYNCLDWNTNVGKMFDETAAWIDRNTELSDRVDEAIKETGAYKLGAAAVDAFSMLWTGAVAIAKFIDDPSSVIDDWANTMKEGSISLLQNVLPGLAEVGNFDFKAQWFLAWYAKAVGLGIAVLAVLFLAATVRAARRGGGQELMATLSYAPLAVALMMFAPGAAYMIEAFCAALADAIVGGMGTSVDELVNNISATLGAVNKDTLVGGTLMGLIGFGLLAIGGFALYVGLLMHQVGIPLASCAMAIGFAFFVYPPMRKKALRIPMTLLSLMLSVPLLFFMLALISDLLNDAAKNATAGTGELQSLGMLTLMALAFIVIGIAPFSMMKWAPILPDTEDADRMGDSGGGSGQIIGAGMGGAIGASRTAGGHSGSGGPVGGQGAQTANKATNAANTSAAGAHAGKSGGHHSGKSGGGGEMGSGISKGSKALGKPGPSRAPRAELQVGSWRRPDQGWAKACR